MNNHYPFALQPLPYPSDALEPHIDKATMEIHHGKHLQTYIDNLNNALKDHSQYHSWPLEKLLLNLSTLPEAIQAPVRNNGGGIYNHNFFFSIMKKGTTPSGSLKDAITRDFGSVETMLAELKQAGLTQFGSGWAWLLSDAGGKLTIAKTPNQDTKIEDKAIPILAVDVWEHAYYIKCQNRRPEYIENWFNVINWDEALKHYEARATVEFDK